MLYWIYWYQLIHQYIIIFNIYQCDLNCMGTVSLVLTYHNTVIYHYIFPSLANHQNLPLFKIISVIKHYLNLFYYIRVHGSSQCHSCLLEQTSRPCPWHSNFVPQKAPDSISEHAFFKHFLGGMPLDPLRRFMLAFRSVLCTLQLHIETSTKIFLTSLYKSLYPPLNACVLCTQSVKLYCSTCAP